MYDLIIYDTSNYTNFPIGGQLTSVRNFLKYIANCQPDMVSRMLLVGITTREEEVGKLQSVELDGQSFAFFPVLYRDSDLSNVQKSLRIEYVKALFRNNKNIKTHRRTLHYIHTPEAYIAVKAMHPLAKTAVFSHGSFFNMVQGFRFFQKNKLVHVLFNQFLVCLIKSADLLFVLDEDSEKQYLQYTNKVCRAENSIILPEQVPVRENCHTPIRLLFVGRLSKVKRVGEIIQAVAFMEGKACLSIIGDGEERQTLEQLVSERNLGHLVTFLGGLDPSDVGAHMRDSDILVMNSALEGKPMTILEAMSYGMPIVTTPVGGIPELVADGENGEFANGTPEGISEKIQMICHNYKSYAEHGLRQAMKYDYREINDAIFQGLNQHLHDF